MGSLEFVLEVGKPVFGLSLLVHFIQLVGHREKEEVPKLILDRFYKIYYGCIINSN